MLKKRYFQLKLPQRDLVPGGFIALLSRGRLKEPTEDTIEKCIRLNLKFDDLHGKGTSTRECKHTESKTVKYLIRRCADIEPRFIKLFTRVKYTKKIKDKYEERLIQRRTEAKKTGKKYKLNRDFMKDGHFSSQKKGMLNVDAREFYNDLFFCNEKDGDSITITAGTSGSMSSSKGTIRKRTALVEKSINANLDEDQKYVFSAKRKRKAKTSVSKASAAKKPRANKKNDAKNVKELKENGGIGRNYNDCQQNVSAEKATGGEGDKVNSVSRSVVEGSQELNVVSSSVK